MRYLFDVSISTHDLLKEGITEQWVTRVLVWSDTGRDEAALIACQMAARHGMPTCLYDCI